MNLVGDELHFGDQLLISTIVDLEKKESTPPPRAEHKSS